MKNLLLLVFILSISSAVFGQYNSSERQLLSLQSMGSGLTIGGYAEITYNDPDSGVSEIDVQRLVMLFAYKFDDRVSFITEIDLFTSLIWLSPNQVSMFKFILFVFFNSNSKHVYFFMIFLWILIT